MPPPLSSLSSASTLLGESINAEDSDPEDEDYVPPVIGDGRGTHKQCPLVSPCSSSSFDALLPPLQIKMIPTRPVLIAQTRRTDSPAKDAESACAPPPRMRPSRLLRIRRLLGGALHKPLLTHLLTHTLL
jgi:hypothetical protein